VRTDLVGADFAAHAVRIGHLALVMERALDAATEQREAIEEASGLVLPDRDRAASRLEQRAISGRLEPELHHALDRERNREARDQS
jgi:hypothetical protein